MRSEWVALNDNKVTKLCIHPVLKWQALQHDAAADDDDDDV